MGVAFDKMHPDGPPSEWIATFRVGKELLEDRDSLSNSLLDHVSENGAHFTASTSGSTTVSTHTLAHAHMYSKQEGCRHVGYMYHMFCVDH